MHAIAELVCSTLGMKVEYLCLHFLFLILLSILIRLSYLGMSYPQFCITYTPFSAPVLGEEVK